MFTRNLAGWGWGEEREDEERGEKGRGGRGERGRWGKEKGEGNTLGHF